MRAALNGTFSALGILVGFFLAGCAVLMTGLAAYEFRAEGFAGAWDIIFHTWPFYLGTVAFLAACWAGWVADRRRAASQTRTT